MKDDRIPFNQRTLEEQRIITRMSLPDVHYQSFRATFHDHLHDVDTGSSAGVRATIVISQPDMFKVWAYAADTATAPLAAISARGTDMLRIYSAIKNLHSAFQEKGLQTDTAPAPPDETTTVDGVVYPEVRAINRATTLKDLFSGSPAISDAAFLTQPSNFAYGYIPNSTLVLSSSVYEGRPVTIMHLNWAFSHGRTQTSTYAPANGGETILWVDTATGIILRIEVYNGQTLERWVSFSDVHFDESVSDVNFESDDAPPATPYESIEKILRPNGRPHVERPAGS